MVAGDLTTPNAARMLLRRVTWARRHTVPTGTVVLKPQVCPDARGHRRGRSGERFAHMTDRRIRVHFGLVRPDDASIDEPA